jgi:hypothetical protein
MFISQSIYNPIIHDRVADGILKLKESVNDDTPLFTFEDIAFVNTAEATEAAQYFMKHGVYTKAPKNSKDYKDFWDREEHKRREGITLNGKLYYDGKEAKIQKIHITGEHYGYLNYGQIKVTKDPRESKFEKRKFNETGGEKVVKNTYLSATKQITFPDFWDGDFYYFTVKEVARGLGLNVCVGKKRRGGYSYKNGFIAANRADLYKDSITVVGAYDSAYLYPEGTMSMTDNYLQFLNKHTDWSKRRLIDSMDHIKIGYKLTDSPEIERGNKSQVIAVSFGPNRPGAARGKDGTLILFEEAGKWANLLQSLASTQPTIEDGIYSTGQILIFGTGGGKDTNWANFEQIFYNPSTYKCISFNNIWDEGFEGTDCGFFVPQYLNMPGFIDKDGNSLKSEAFDYEKKQKERIKKTSQSTTDLDDYMMEKPNCPSEAFKRSGNNIFPVEMLSQHEKHLMKNVKLNNLGRVGLLVRTKTGVRLNIEANVSPLIHYPTKPEDNLNGAFVEWSPPFKVGGVVPKNLYRVWHDPFAVDKTKENITTRDSLGVTYVFEKPNNFTKTKGNRIVAAYAGRPARTDEYNEQLFLIAEYYNTYEGLQFENDRGEVIPYAKRYKLLEYLAAEPEIVWKKELSGKTGRNWGIHINTARKETGIIYLKDWLLEEVEKDINGNSILNLHYIFDLGLVRELIKFNNKGNFDRISTMIVGMFDYKEELVSGVVASSPEHSRQFDEYFN